MESKRQPKGIQGTAEGGDDCDNGYDFGAIFADMLAPAGSPDDPDLSLELETSSEVKEEDWFGRWAVKMANPEGLNIS